ncbi:MAG: circadian clock protein KaiB [Betaproteobacteria bacterium]|nr:circadian clock protein KaiB [Betaproteobacteria bacterium]
MPRYLLKLYVTGQTPQSRRAMQNLRKICETELTGGYEIEVVDILKSPALAEQDKILATPAVIRQLPEPIKMVIGDLSDRTEVLLGLDIIAKEV